MLKEKLGRELLFFDGGMGTLLQKKGLLPGEMPEVWNMEHEDVIQEIHKSYLDAGSDIILTNTFGANKIKFHNNTYTIADIVNKAVDNVRIAAKKAGKEQYFVALDVGPTGKLLKPMGDLAFEDAYEAFKEVMVCGQNAGVDLIHIETMSDTYEVKSAILAAKENTNLPVFATLIFEVELIDF